MWTLYFNDIDQYYTEFIVATLFDIIIQKIKKQIEKLERFQVVIHISAVRDMNVFATNLIGISLIEHAINSNCDRIL